jgi:hypothetical protein
VINARDGCFCLAGLHKPLLRFPSSSLSPSRTPPPPHDHTKTRPTSAGDGGPARRRVQRSLWLLRPSLQSSPPLRSMELNLTVWRIKFNDAGPRLGGAYLDSAAPNQPRRRARQGWGGRAWWSDDQGRTTGASASRGAAVGLAGSARGLPGGSLMSRGGGLSGAPGADCWGGTWMSPRRGWRWAHEQRRGGATAMAVNQR